jgi:type IV fimbrial biogenesis protein FimT
MKNVRYRGFSLIEMMIALVVLGVLLMVSAPAFRELIQNNRMLTHVYEMRAALNNSRSEALAQRKGVTFCRSNDGEACGGNWNEGYIAFTDSDGDGTVDDPNDPDGDQIFIAKLIDADSLDITYSNGNMVQFNSRGYAIGPGGSTSGTFTICDYRGAEDASGVIVTAGGIVRAADDPNDTGVALDLGGNPLVCP